MVRGFMIQHRKVAKLNDDRVHSLLATENESMPHHSSDAIVLLFCAEHPIVLHHVV